MGNVVHIHQKTPKDGEQTFMFCGCNIEGVELFPVVLIENQKPIIVSLFCPECENELAVINGIVQTQG